MAAAWVRQTGTPNKNGGNSSTITMTVGATGPVSGNLLVAVVGWISSFATCTVADPTNGSWTQLVTRRSGNNQNVSIFYKDNTAALTAGTVITATFSATVTAQIIAADEYSGMTITSGDASGTNAQAASSLSVASSSIAQADELLIGAIAGGSGANVLTAGSGYTKREDVAQSTGNLLQLGMEEKILTGGSGAQTATWTIDTITTWAEVIGTFKTAASGSAPVNTVAPAITGTVSLGNTLTVSDGTWTNSPTGFTYQWQRSSDGSTWNAITNNTPEGGGTSNTHTVVGFDVASSLRCQVTATNAFGSVTATSSPTTEVGVPSTPSVRMVALPITQSDHQGNSNVLHGAVLPNETLVLVASTSIGSISGDMGIIDDGKSNTWTLDHDSGGGIGVGHITQAFSAQNGSFKMNIGETVSHTIKQNAVTAAGAALNSSTIPMFQNPGFDPAGGILNIGPGSSPLGTVTYTGISGATLTGCGNHVAIAAFEVIIYHGQSPYWAVYALNPGDGSGSRMVYDGSSSLHATRPTNAGSAGTVVSSQQKGVALTLILGGGPDTNTWLTPGSGWAVDFSGFLANHLSGGASDAFGIQYSGESGYKIGVQTKTWSSAGTSITGDYTGDTGVGGQQDSLVILYGFTPSGSSPSNTVAPAVTGTAQEGNTLSCTTGTWTNSPTGYTYQWQRDVAGNAVFSNIVGATSSTYLLASGDVGNSVRCVVTATNASGSASANSNTVASISARAPVNTVAPNVTGTAVQGQTLSCNTGTWDLTISSYTYQWQRDTAGNGVFSNIGSATSSTYLLAAGDVGNKVRCRVTAQTSNGGNATASSNEVGLVTAPTAPVNTVAPTVSGIAYQAYTLTVTDNGTWTQSPTGYTYQWQRDVAGNGVFSNIASATSASYVLVSADLNNKVRCVVTATNVIGSTAANSNQLGPVGTAPAAGTAKAMGVGGGAFTFFFHGEG